MTEPKVFISYAWTSPEHIEWVIRLATDLRAQGVDALLDKWDLKEGHDANAFMERMVSDDSVERVIMVCDIAYCQKADARSGGVGTEAQIISPALYAKKEQDKFVAIVREKGPDGRSVVPIFYGSRIHIDMTDDDQYSDNIEKILRWVFGKPSVIKPPIGSRPSYLDQTAEQRTGNSSLHRLAMDALKRSAANAKALSEDYLDSVIAGLDDHRIPFTDDVDQFEYQFLNSIERFVPTKNELIELFSSLARHVSFLDASDVIAKFFEKLALFQLVPENVSRYRRGDFDNFKFISNELFLCLIAVLVKREKFDVIASVLSATYYQPGRHGSQGTVETFTIFAGFLDALEHRNQRLRLGRVSLKADYLQERCTGTSVTFPEIIQADLILYIRSQFDALTTKHSRGRWYPHTIIYAASFSGAFEIFVRATSKQYFEKIKLIFGVDDAETFKTLLAEVGPINSNYDRISLRELCNTDDIASR